jgi:hypothetical protein
MSEATSGNERDAGPGFRVRSSGLRFQFSNSRAVLPIHSLPPCGGGLGMGVSRKRRSSRYPPSPTLPRKGERAHRVRRHGNHGFNFQTASFTDTVSRSRRMFARAFWERPAPWRSEGAGNAGRPPRPQPRMRYKNKAHGVVTAVTPVSPGIPCAMVLTVSFVLSPVTGLFCHRRRRKVVFRKLDTSVGAPGPHDFAVRLTRRSSLKRHQRPPHPVPRP